MFNNAQNLFVHDESAHPAGDAEAAGSTRGTMMEWVRKIQVCIQMPPAVVQSSSGASLIPTQLLLKIAVLALRRTCC